jgi:hypothetical protein
MGKSGRIIPRIPGRLGACVCFALAESKERHIGRKTVLGQLGEPNARWRG